MTHSDYQRATGSDLGTGTLLLVELKIRVVGRTLDKEITRIKNMCHDNDNLDSVTL